MKWFNGNLEQLTVENDFFRKVLYTGKNSQLVLMSLLPNEEVGSEIHAENDQFFRFEEGEGKVIIDDSIYEVSDGIAIIIPAGANHNIINTSDTKKLKMYTIYSPAHHKDQIIHETREIAEEAEERGDEEFDGIITE